MNRYPPSRIIIPLQRQWTQKPPLGARLNLGHPLVQGLDVCWLCNEGQGNRLYDLTGQGHHVRLGLHAEANTTTVWDAARLQGVDGPVLRSLAGSGFDPADPTNIDVPIVLPPRQYGFTLECWIQIRPEGIGTDVAFLNAAPSFGNVTIQLGASAPVLTYSDGTSTHGITLAYHRWMHVMLVHRLILNTFSFLHMYWDGQRQGGGQILGDTQHRWHSLFTGLGLPHFPGDLGLLRIWRRALLKEDVQDLLAHPYAMVASRPTILVSQAPPVPPARLQWRAQTLGIARLLRVAHAQSQWRAQAGRVIGALGQSTPARMAWRPGLFHRALTITPSRLRWTSTRQQLPVGLNIRDCGEEYEAALQRTSIGGDWLISAPALGLFLSFNYEAGGGWEHRILDISDIEISAPPGGGIASAANVTVSVAETGSGQSIVTLWEQASAVGAVTVTIDFLLAGADQVLRIFTGSIDSITVKDAVAQLLLVDDSIRKNLILPTDIVTVEAFPNADQAALTKAIPLLYGQGGVIGAAPLLFVDVPNNIYLLAAHPMQVGGKLAVYDQPNKTFLTLDSIVVIPNNGTATITLGTLNTEGLRVTQDVTVGAQAGNAIDGISTTTTVVPTNLAGPHAPKNIPLGDGWGYAGWSPSMAGAPRAGTLKIDITNHRRSPGSDPTTFGTFWFRTINPEATVEHRILYVSPTFNHVTSAQNNTFILSNVNIGINEVFQILLVAQCQGTIGNASQTYEVGEVSVTPLVAFSANISGTLTAVGLPINVQELRFNTVRPTLSYYTASFVANATQAIDGNSLTTAAVRTLGVDSNLDGYGQLIVATDVTSALRANNTVVIDLLNHRRGVDSAPTVTGTFSIQTYNTATGVLLRDNLFVTQAFRHQTNPISTSYVATAINMGATAQIAVRLVARNEGGSGAAVDWYEVGEIGIESFYQPRGDSDGIFLFGAGYEGRTDVDGTVTDYIGSTPGRLFQTPDQVIASIFEQELGLMVDLESFATAYNFCTVFGLRFDGGIGAGWALEQANARDLLDALAKQATAILFPTFEATWGMRPFRVDTAIHQAFDSSTILTDVGSEQQRAEDRQSTVQLTLGNLQNVYNHFEVRYKYNVGSRKYDRVWKVTKDGSNLPVGALNKAAIEESCLTSWLRYGDLEPLIVEAYWIADDATAAYYLRHLALYFSQQRLTVQFETTFKGACLQVGDFITITDNSLPTGDNGGVFEVHTIRYRPLHGRIQLIASRVSSIPDVTMPPAPPALVGCQRFETTAGMLACWDFEEANGSRIDHLHEYSLTAVNNPLGVQGKVGNAVKFLRASSQCLLGDNILAGAMTGAFTLAFWVRLLSSPSDPWAVVTNGTNIDIEDYESGFFLYPGFGSFASRGWGGVATAPLPFTGTEADWTLIRCWRTFDASFTGALFVQVNNGSVNASPLFTAVPIAYNAFTVGAAYVGGGTLGLHANLLLDQLMIWPRVLTQAEHDAIWNGGLG